jgi:tRNA threonylcarbamoyladenosine biosynthesis protein TsaE
MTGLFEVSSVEETWALAEKFAATLKRGDIVCLEGDLGAGKTTFTQGLAAALKVKGRVTSPTFCIVQEHYGTDDESFMLVHMDLYRLEGENDVLSIGWEDYLERGAVLVVEWPERAGTLVPQSARHVVFRHPEADEDSQRRRITFS